MILTCDKLEKHLLNKKLIYRISLGWNYISTTIFDSVHSEGVNMLKKDPLFFLKSKPQIDFN